MAARTSTSLPWPGKRDSCYVFDRVTGAPIWPIEERPVPKSDMPGEQSWPTQPYPTKPSPFSRQSFSADDINPYPIVTDEAREAFRKRLAGARNLGLFTPIGFVDAVHMPGANGGALFGYTAAEPSGKVYVIGLNDAGVLKLLPPKPGGPGASPGQAVYQRECQVCHGADRGGTQTGPTLLTLTGRVDAATIRSTIGNGKGRMPAFPHINDVDIDALITYLTTPPPGGGRGRGAGPAPTFPPGPVVASGGAQARPAGGGRGRGGLRPYPDGVDQIPQYVIDSYGLTGAMTKPPFTSLTKYDLNTGVVAWQVGLGDHARLAALGVTGTGTTQMRSSLIVTAGGLLFAPGGDSKVRAFDTDTGKVVWDRGAGRRDQRSAIDVRDRRPAVPVGASLGRSPGGRTAAGRRGAGQSPEGIRRVRATEEVRRASLDLGRGHGRNFHRRLTGLAGHSLVHVGCGADPLSGLFDVPPDFRFGADGVVRPQRIQDGHVPLGDFVQRPVRHRMGDTRGHRQAHRLPDVLEHPVAGRRDDGVVKRRVRAGLRPVIVTRSGFAHRADQLLESTEAGGVDARRRGARRHASSAARMG